MRKILTIVCLTLACGLLRAEVYTGNCGAESDPSNIQWRLDTETGWLEFTGSGLMKDDFYQSKAPWAAYNSSIQYVRLASGITSVGNYAFKGCYNLLSVDMPATVTRIGKEAFRDCYKLAMSGLHEGVTSVGDYAFATCYQIKSFTIPTTLKAIAAGMFYSGSLESITLHNNLTEIGNWAFYGNQDLTAIDLPGSLLTIGFKAFHYSGLTALTVPNSVTTIDNNAFQDCESLVTVTLGTGLTRIQAYVFDGCESLTDITIPEGITHISDYAFMFCKALPSLHLPASLQFVGEESFSGCTGLEQLTCEAVNPPYGQYRVFYRIDNTIPVYVPAQSVTAYQQDSYWSYFTNIQPIGGTPTGAATATACPAPLPAKTLRNGQHLIILPAQDNEQSAQSITYHISGIPCR